MLPFFILKKKLFISFCRVYLFLYVILFKTYSLSKVKYPIIKSIFKYIMLVKYG